MSDIPRPSGIDGNRLAYVPPEALPERVLGAFPDARHFNLVGGVKLAPANTRAEAAIAAIGCARAPAALRGELATRLSNYRETLRAELAAVSAVIEALQADTTITREAPRPWIPRR